MNIESKSGKCTMFFSNEKGKVVFKAKVEEGTLLAVSDSTRFFALKMEEPIGIGFKTKAESDKFVVEFMKKMYEKRNYKGRRRVMPSVPAKFLSTSRKKAEAQTVVETPEQQSFNVYRQLENRFIAAMHESESTKSPSQSPPPPSRDKRKYPQFFRKKNTRSSSMHSNPRREAFVLHSTVSQAVIVPPKPTPTTSAAIDVDNEYPFETEEERKERKLSTKVDEKFVDAVAKRVSRMAAQMVEQKKKNDEMWKKLDKDGQQEAVEEAKAVLTERVKDLLKQRVARDVDKGIASRPIWTSSGNKHIHTAVKPQAELKVSFAFHRRGYSSSDPPLSSASLISSTEDKKPKEETTSKTTKQTGFTPDESEDSSDSVSTPMISSASVSTSASAQTLDSSSSSSSSKKDDKDDEK